MDGLVGAFAQFEGTFDKSEDGVEPYLVKEGVGGEVGGAYAQGAFLVESSAHTYKGGEDEQESQRDAPGVGEEGVESAGDGAAEDEAQEEPVACGDGKEGKETAEVHGFGENHVGDDGKGVGLVGGSGVETGEEVAEERNVGSAGEEGDNVADEKEVVGNEVIEFCAYASQFAYYQQECRESQEVATDSGVETPAHDKGFPVEAIEIGPCGLLQAVDKSARQPEKGEKGDACKIGKKDVFESCGLFHNGMQSYDFFLKQQLLTNMLE